MKSVHESLSDEFHFIFSEFDKLRKEIYTKEKKIEELESVIID